MYPFLFYEVALSSEQPFVFNRKELEFSSLFLIVLGPLLVVPWHDSHTSDIKQ